MASIIMSSCGLKPTEAPVDGSKVDDDAFNLTGTVVTNDGGLLKKPAMPTYACAEQRFPTIMQQPVPSLMSRIGPLEVHLRSSNWGKSMDENLLAAGQSAASGAGFRILGLNGGQSPVSAPWTGLDQIIITAGTKTVFNPLTNLFGSMFYSMLGLRGQLEKIKTDGSVEFNMPLKFDSKALPIRTPTGTNYAVRALLDKPLAPGAYRIFVATENRPVTIDIDVRPGDVNNSFSVDVIDQEFYLRNLDKSVNAVASPDHQLGLIKADLNADGQVDKLDLQAFQKLSPAASSMSSDFAGDLLSKNAGDIAAIEIRALGWSSTFRAAMGSVIGDGLGSGNGFRIAPASCQPPLPWRGMNQIILTSGGERPLSGSMTISTINNKSEAIIFTTSLEKLTKIKTSFYTSALPIFKSGIYQIKLSVNNQSKLMDGVVTRIIKFRVLEGDVDGSYIVDTADLDLMKQQLLSTNPFGTLTNSSNFRMDLDGNGFVTAQDTITVRANIGQKLEQPSSPNTNVPNTPPEQHTVTEKNKVSIVDANGQYLSGIIAAQINGQTVAKVELNGLDAGIVEVKGPFGSKVVWINNLSSDTFETILDGKGDYGQGHYVIFKAESYPVAPPQQPSVTEINKVHINDGNGRMVPGVIAATINGQTVAKVGLNGNDAGLVQVTGPFGSKVVWINNLNSDKFETVLDGKGDYGQGHYVIFRLSDPTEKGGCGRYFGGTAGSFPSNKDECFMKQQDIDSTCKNYSGADYKVNWTRFNSDGSIRETLNLQSGTCMKLPAQPPSMDDQLKSDQRPQQDFTDVELGIFSEPTASKFQTCIRASVNGQPEIELACNRPAPFKDYGGDINKSVKVRMQKGVCNILRLSMHTRQTPSEPFRQLTTISDRVFNSATRPLFGPGVIVDFGGDSYSLMGNDNGDSRWDDIVFKLRNPYPGQLQFMIEGAKGGCNSAALNPTFE